LVGFGWGSCLTISDALYLRYLHYKVRFFSPKRGKKIHKICKNLIVSLKIKNFKIGYRLTKKSKSAKYISHHHHQGHYCTIESAGELAAGESPSKFFLNYSLKKVSLRKNFINKTKSSKNSNTPNNTDGPARTSIKTSTNVVVSNHA